MIERITGGWRLGRLPGSFAGFCACGCPSSLPHIRAQLAWSCPSSSRLGGDEEHLEHLRRVEFSRGSALRIRQWYPMQNTPMLDLARTGSRCRYDVGRWMAWRVLRQHLAYFWDRPWLDELEWGKALTRPFCFWRQRQESFWKISFSLWKQSIVS